MSLRPNDRTVALHKSGQALESQHVGDAPILAHRIQRKSLGQRFEPIVGVALVLVVSARTAACHRPATAMGRLC